MVLLSYFLRHWCTDVRTYEQSPKNQNFQIDGLPKISGYARRGSTTIRHWKTKVMTLTYQKEARKETWNADRPSTQSNLKKIHEADSKRGKTCA